MTLFNPEVAPAPPPRPLRRTPTRVVVGLYAMVVAMLALFALTSLPTDLVIQQPGPVVDTLGTAKNTAGEDVALITVDGAETYPTEGTLDLLTVQVVGNREHTPSWFELAAAWFDPSRAVVPIDVIFPEGKTTEQRQEENALMMSDSQKEATAAALTSLGYEVNGVVRVADVPEGGAAVGIVETDDIVVSANGTPITVAQDLRDVIAASEGSPVSITVLRDGEEKVLSVTPVRGEIDGEPAWLIGVQLTPDFTFPIDVTIQIDNIGGPSAGMMFALGIIDKLTPGSLTGGHNVAGTGTIDAVGDVGPIGGIRQKLYGALGAGAEYFLAPESNCDEVIDHIPGDLRVFSVKTLDDALAVLSAIESDGDLDALPTCTSP